jgi:hypothetical protein
VFRLTGLTPRGIRYGTRQETRERREQTERIVTNLEAYEWQKERARANRASDERMAKLDAEQRRSDNKIQTMFDGSDKRADSMYGEVMTFLGNASRDGLTPENIADSLLDDDDDDYDDGDPVVAARRAPRTVDAQLALAAHAHQVQTGAVFAEADNTMAKIRRELAMPDGDGGQITAGPSPQRFTIKFPR